MHTTDGKTLADLKEIDPNDARKTKNRKIEEAELLDGSVYYPCLVDDTKRGIYGN